MTVPRTYNVLFLCTGNSARSIIAEALLRAESCEEFATPGPLERVGHVVGGSARRLRLDHGYSRTATRLS